MPSYESFIKGDLQNYTVTDEMIAENLAELDKQYTTYLQNKVPPLELSGGLRLNTNQQLKPYAISI